MSPEFIYWLNNSPTAAALIFVGGILLTYNGIRFRMQCMWIEKWVRARKRKRVA